MQINAHIEAKHAVKVAGSQVWPVLHFPADYFSADSKAVPADTLVGQLDAESSQRCIAMAQSLALAPSEFAFTLYLFYISKLLQIGSCQHACSLGVSAQYQWLDINFAGVRSLNDLASQVQQQLQVGIDSGHRLLTQADGSVQRNEPDLCCLFGSTAAIGSSKDRYGFDLVVRLREHGGCLFFSLDYDAMRLHPVKMKLFMVNYLKLIKALVDNNTAAVRSGGQSAAAAD